MAPYLTDPKLKMLCHGWSTQKNEAMNNSVASYAPKTKNFNGTLSLKTRVGTAAAVMSLGYHTFWTRVLNELGLEMDDVFESSLMGRDCKKEKKRKRQKSKCGKLQRRKTDLEKFAEAHREQMDDARTGKTYGAGVALATAKKQANAKLTAAARNPKGTPKELLRCPYYHPLHCTALGHTSAANKECGVKHKTKEERIVILATLKSIRIQEELALQNDGMSIYLRFIIVHLYQVSKI